MKIIPYHCTSDSVRTQEFDESKIYDLNKLEDILSLLNFLKPHANSIHSDNISKLLTNSDISLHQCVSYLIGHKKNMSEIINAYLDLIQKLNNESPDIFSDGKIDLFTFVQSLTNLYAKQHGARCIDVLISFASNNLPYLNALLLEFNSSQETLLQLIAKGGGDYTFSKIQELVVKISSDQNGIGLNVLKLLSHQDSQGKTLKDMLGSNFSDEFRKFFDTYRDAIPVMQLLNFFNKKFEAIDALSEKDKTHLLRQYDHAVSCFLSGGNKQGVPQLSSRFFTFFQPYDVYPQLISKIDDSFCKQDKPEWFENEFSSLDTKVTKLKGTDETYEMRLRRVF